MSMSSKLKGLCLVGFCGLSLAAATEPNPTDPNPSLPIEAPAPILYADVSTIIADNCQFCHTGPDAYAEVVLDSEADVVAQAKIIYNSIDSGIMPFGDAEWKNTEDGQKVLSYLKGLIPADPVPSPVPAPAVTL